MSVDTTTHPADLAAALDTPVARVTAALLETDALTANREPSDGLYVVHEADVEHLVSTVLTLAASQAPEVDPASFRAGYTAGQADAYTGAADDPGDLATVPTDAEWLRRLLDLPAPQRLAAASYYQAAMTTAQRCHEENHEGRLDAATAQLDAARTAVEDAARVTADHYAEVRRARNVASERAWDAAADYLTGTPGPDMARTLRASNPYRDHDSAAGVTEVHAWGSDELLATFPEVADLAWTERLHDAVGVDTDDQGDDQ